MAKRYFHYLCRMWIDPEENPDHKEECEEQHDREGR